MRPSPVRAGPRPGAGCRLADGQSAATGGIDYVVNGTGGPATIANPDTPVNVVSRP